MLVLARGARYAGRTNESPNSKRARLLESFAEMIALRAEVVRKIDGHQLCSLP